MTEVTRVPLQPIAKGSLTKLWLGVILALLAGAGLAWAAIPKGLSVDTLQEGSGPMAKTGDVVFVKYTGKLPDGMVFDEHKPLPLPPGLLPDGTPFLLEEGQVIDGFFEGLQKVQKGGKYELYIPAAQGYGDAPPPDSQIPANSDLVFEVEVVDIMNRTDAEARFQAAQQMMQQMMEQQGGAPGAPGAAPAQPPQ